MARSGGRSPRSPICSSRRPATPRISFQTVLFVRLAYFPGGTEAQYLALSRELADAPAPAERRFVAAGALGDGWQVVQVWDSREALDAFNQQWLFPAMQRLGSASFPALPEVRDFVAKDVWLGAERLE